MQHFIFDFALAIITLRMLFAVGSPNGRALKKMKQNRKKPPISFFSTLIFLCAWLLCALASFHPDPFFRSRLLSSISWMHFLTVHSSTKLAPSNCASPVLVEPPPWQTVEPADAVICSNIAVFIPSFTFLCTVCTVWWLKEVRVVVFCVRYSYLRRRGKKLNSKLHLGINTQDRIKCVSHATLYQYWNILLHTEKGHYL